MTPKAETKLAKLIKLCDQNKEDADLANLLCTVLGANEVGKLSKMKDHINNFQS